MRDNAGEDWMTEPAGTVPQGTAIVCRGLRLEIGGKALIRALDLDLAPRGVSVVMGPNGAGKSLLLRLIHGLQAPTGGEVTIDGQPLDRRHALQQALVFQRPVLLRRSVAANLDFVLKARACGGRAERDALLDKVGLLGKAGQPARLLSGGEQQRLALARALATRPRLLLLDEPTASLDPASVHVIEEIVRGAATAGTRVILVTHDLGQARRMADDVVFLVSGQVAEHLPAKEFFEMPRTEAARAFLEGRLVL